MAGAALGDGATATGAIADAVGRSEDESISDLTGEAAALPNNAAGDDEGANGAVVDSPARAVEGAKFAGVDTEEAGSTFALGATAVTENDDGVIGPALSPLAITLGAGPIETGASELGVIGAEGGAETTAALGAGPSATGAIAVPASPAGAAASGAGLAI